MVYKIYESKLEEIARNKIENQLAGSFEPYHFAGVLDNPFIINKAIHINQEKMKEFLNPVALRMFDSRYNLIAIAEVSSCHYPDDEDPVESLLERSFDKLKKYVDFFTHIRGPPETIATAGKIQNILKKPFYAIEIAPSAQRAKEADKFPQLKYFGLSDKTEDVEQICGHIFPTLINKPVNPRLKKFLEYIGNERIESAAALTKEATETILENFLHLCLVKMYDSKGKEINIEII